MTVANISSQKKWQRRYLQKRLFNEITIMKELSIKEKAKRYDEAIETARKINNGESVEALSDWTTCEIIFPELRESENERIKKEIIKFIQHNTLILSSQQEKYIAWLEKQSE